MKSRYTAFYVARDVASLSPAGSGWRGIFCFGTEIVRKRRSNFEPRRTCVLKDQLRDEWCARERAVPISPVMRFTHEGLVLGAGTVLVASDGVRRLKRLKGRERVLLALLSAAYGKAVAPAVLGNIERASRCWSDGDDCLAYIYLAHARLQPPEVPRAAARRLFIADRVMSGGVAPRAIFRALELGSLYIDAVEKAYNPAEPRVPAGSGRTSGEWTGDERASDVSLSATLAAPSAALLGDLFPAAADSLGEFAAGLLARFGGPAAAVFGLLFIPSSNNLNVTGEVPGVPGLSYSLNRDEALLHLSYVDADGETTNSTAQLEDEVFRGQNGNVVARILPGGNIVVDKAAVFPDSANDDEPRLCPMPGLDKPGESGRDYEDYVKSIVNPVDTTPRYWGFQLLDPTSGAFVYYDDCEHTTGTMVDAKGPGYANLLTYDKVKASVAEKFLDESARQLAALGTRELCWYFAEPEAAAFAEELFRTEDKGRERIEVRILPWLPANKALFFSRWERR
jgi:hypothetical protein